MIFRRKSPMERDLIVACRFVRKFATSPYTTLELLSCDTIKDGHRFLLFAECRGRLDVAVENGCVTECVNTTRAPMPASPANGGAS